jgi:hypothetical protein
MRDLVVSGWKFIFDHEYSPLRHIPDVGTRHMVFQLLAWMWATVFAISVGSYLALGVSLVAHALIISAAAITVATYSTATLRPRAFVRSLGRRLDGEHM